MAAEFLVALFHPFCFSSCEGGGGGRERTRWRRFCSLRCPAAALASRFGRGITVASLFGDSLALICLEDAGSRGDVDLFAVFRRKEREVRMGIRVGAPGVARCSMDAVLGGGDGGGYDLRKLSLNFTMLYNFWREKDQSLNSSSYVYYKIRLSYA